MGIRTDGTLWTWGGNEDGQLGDGSTGAAALPKKVGTATTWTSLAAGKAHSFGLQSDGSLWTWGRGLEGQLGDGRLANRTAPAILP
jgi:alpha-tubulin suppressor-like RCC1 family protein